MNINKIAIQCGFYYREGFLDLAEMSDYTGTIALERFAKAVIAAYVAEQKPAYWVLKTGHGIDIQEFKPVCGVDYWKPLYTLENSK